MRVFVTGAAGFIGTETTRELIANGHQVVGLARSEANVGTLEKLGAEVHRGSLQDLESLKRGARDCDAVIHLAGLCNDPLGDLNPELTYDINHRASVRLARLAKDVGVSRFIFSSSCSNYGAGGEDMLTEESPFNPVTPYGKSKVMVEQDVSKLADDKFSPTFLRNATAFGASPRLRFDLVLNNLTAWALTTGRIYMKSDGTPWRPIVHIADISRAFIAVLSAPRELVHNQAFNVGRNEDNYRVRELAAIVKETVPDCRIDYAEGAGPDKRCYRVDCSKIMRMLPEFKPQWSARSGARELHSAYQQVGLTVEEFEGERYKRLGQIQKLLREGQIDASLRWKN